MSFHVSGLWQGEMPLAGVGYLGVDLFFILSGFVLAYVHGNAFRRDPLKAYPHFLGRRIARIFPVWLVVLAVFAVKHRETVLPEHIFIYAILTQSWGFIPTQLMNPPGWSVSLEWAGYLLFPLVAFVPLRVTRVSSALALIVMMLALLLVGYLYAGGVSIHDNDDWYPLRFVCEFTIGILIARAITFAPASSNELFARALGLILLMGAIFVPFIGRNLTADLLFIAGFSAWLYFLAQGDNRLLASGPVRWLGERSYSLYVVHWLPLELVWKHADSGAIPKILAAALIVACAMVGAALLYATVELPARRYLRARMG